MRRSQLSAIATQLRRAATFGELRSAKLRVAFRRSVALRGCIGDFYASRARLVVEVDGGCHVEQVTADARRDRELERAGFSVLRLGEELVVRRRAEAVARARAALVG